MVSMRVTLNGQQVLARSGQTILELCREQNIPIPTLCHDDRLPPLGTCQVCVVEVQGYGLVSSCATRVADGMVIQTHTPRVIALRRERLQALCAEHYGDCVAPCQEACPAGVNIPGYIALIARGAYAEAVHLIKETLPLPAVISRICPHPCENACRRRLVDEPVAVCALKRFADEQGQDEELDISVAEPTGFRVAIVGAGPSGLTAAYYLAQKGHAVTIFEALPEPGGMIRYGIPDFRLPKEILDEEIAAITRIGVQILTGRALGRDFTLQSLFEEGFHAVYLALGAQQSQRMNVEGEDLDGVLSGIDFLRAVACGQPPAIGRRVAVIGGGNTAMDAARTAIRLGAEKVTVVYRRSRSEMPAMPWEVAEAEEEGIEFLFLAAPVRIVGEDGVVSGIECIRMRLGEPDASGRRQPEPLLGSEFFLPVDTVIAAIGQRPDLSCLGECGLETRRGNIVVDPDTFQTRVPGVFAGGDCVSGAATAVEAIAAGRQAAMAIDCYLRGDPLPVRPIRFRKGTLEELRDRPEFALVEHQPRQKMPVAPPEARRHDFRPVELGYSKEMALREAARCLQCGCRVAETCSLRQYATEYGFSPVAPPREVWYPLDTSHPFILRDPNKCIGCQRCARLCREVQGVGALAIAYRVSTAEGYGGSLLNTPCESCGLCVSGCPVGALVAKNELPPGREVRTICPYCGVGCGLYLGVRGNRVVSARGDTDNPVNQGLLCVKGRFGYEFIHHPERLTRPLIRKNGGLVEATWDEALDLVAAQLARYRGDAFATITSAKCTNEENYVIQKFTRAVMGTNNIDHCARL